WASARTRRRWCAGRRCSRRRHLQEAPQAVQVELGLVTQRTGDGAKLLQGLPAGLDAQEVLGRGRSPLGEPGRAHRGPAGLEGVVEQVAVAEVLDEEPVRVPPVVEDLAALD